MRGYETIAGLIIVYSIFGFILGGCSVQPDHGRSAEAKELCENHEGLDEAHNIFGELRASCNNGVLIVVKPPANY